MKKRLPNDEYNLIVKENIKKAKDLKVPYTHAIWEYKINNVEYDSFHSQSYVTNNMKLMIFASNHIALTQYADRDNRLVQVNGSPVDYSSAANVTLNPSSTRGVSAGDLVRGILVGTSNTPENINDRHLPGLIPHGVSANQLNYDAEHVFETVFEISNNRWRSTQARRFTNNSGGSITVREIGLQTSIGIPGFLLIRDVPLTEIVIPNGGQLTLTLNKYTISPY